MQPKREPLAVAAALAIAAWAPVAAHARAPAPRPPPRLQLMASPVVGMHSEGEEIRHPRGLYDECDRGGRFFGVGGTVELRARALGPLYVHARGLALGNVTPPAQAVHAGLGGGGLGLGLYARLAFVRAEYMVLGTFGSNTYRPPFGDPGAARDRFGRHAGLLSAGVRAPLGRRLNVELWGGMTIGPRAERTTTSPIEGNDRVLVSGLFGVGLSFDLIAGALSE